jgi:hypothetical protein
MLMFPASEKTNKQVRRLVRRKMPRLAFLLELRRLLNWLDGTAEGFFCTVVSPILVFSLILGFLQVLPVWELEVVGDLSLLVLFAGFAFEVSVLIAFMTEWERLQNRTLVSVFSEALLRWAKNYHDRVIKKEHGDVSWIWESWWHIRKSYL